MDDNTRKEVIKTLSKEKLKGRRIIAMSERKHSVVITLDSGDIRYLTFEGLTTVQVAVLWDSIPIEPVESEAAHYETLNDYLSAHPETVYARAIKEEYQHDILKSAIVFAQGLITTQTFVTTVADKIQAATELIRDEYDGVIIKENHDLAVYDKIRWIKT